MNDKHNIKLKDEDFSYTTNGKKEHKGKIIPSHHVAFKNYHASSITLKHLFDDFI